MAPDEGPL